MSEQFYRNIAALQQTGTAFLEIDDERQLCDLDSWVLTQLGARRGENILNIGCDSNELMVALAHTLGPDGHIVTVDSSYRALTALSLRSQEVRLEQHIRFLYLHLDDLAGHLRSEDVHCVLSGPTLAQIRRPQAVFRAIRQALKPGGTFFFYGPARKDRLELHHFCAKLSGERRESRALTFVEQIGLPHARDAFPHVEIVRFECLLCFTSPEALYSCWRESDFYEEELDHRFQHAARQYFQMHPAFETARRLAGMKAIKE